MRRYRGFVVGEFLRPDAAPALAATQAVPMLESKALVQLILAKEAGQARPGAAIVRSMALYGASAHLAFIIVGTWPFLWHS